MCTCMHACVLYKVHLVHVHMYTRSTRTHTTDSVPYSEASADDHRPVRVLLHSSLVVAVLLALEHGAENDLTHSPPNPHQPLLPSQECTLQFTTIVNRIVVFISHTHYIPSHSLHTLTPCSLTSPSNATLTVLKHPSFTSHTSHLTRYTSHPYPISIPLTKYHVLLYTLIAIMPHITTTMLPSDNSLMHHPLLFCVTAIAQPSAIMG